MARGSGWRGPGPDLAWAPDRGTLPLSHPARTLGRVTFACPECGQDLEELDAGAGEMGSTPRRFLCHECQLVYERDAAGTLLEVEDR